MWDVDGGWVWVGGRGDGCGWAASIDNAVQVSRLTKAKTEKGRGSGTVVTGQTVEDLISAAGRTGDRCAQMERIDCASSKYRKYHGALHTLPPAGKAPDSPAEGEGSTQFQSEPAPIAPIAPARHPFAPACPPHRTCLPTLGACLASSSCVRVLVTRHPLCSLFPTHLCTHTFFFFIYPSHTPERVTTLTPSLTLTWKSTPTPSLTLTSATSPHPPSVPHPPAACGPRRHASHPIPGLVDEACKSELRRSLERPPVHTHYPTSSPPSKKLTRCCTPPCQSCCGLGTLQHLQIDPGALAAATLSAPLHH